MARARLPDNETVYNAVSRLQIAPQYASSNRSSSIMASSNRSRQPYDYGQQQAYGQPRLRPAHLRPAAAVLWAATAYYGQQQGYYAPQGYPPQPPPVYRQW